MAHRGVGMKTDSEFKVLFNKHAAELLVLTGDGGAMVLDVDSVELPELRQAVDCVLKLEHSGEVYYRHVEFQAEARSDMALRCFRYNARLIAHFEAPVVTTVIYPFPPGPRGDLVFRVVVGGREENKWRFDTVRLWKLDARWALETGEPGVMALIPFMRGGRDLPLITAAARRIEEKLPGTEMSEAEQVLLLFAGRYYTVEEVQRVAGGRDVMIQSSVWQAALNEGVAKGRVEGLNEGLAKGLNEGRAEGRVEAEREVCSDLMRELHPTIADRAQSVIESCSDPAVLKRWALLAAKGTDADLLKELGLD